MKENSTREFTLKFSTDLACKSEISHNFDELKESGLYIFLVELAFSQKPFCRANEFDEFSLVIFYVSIYFYSNCLYMQLLCECECVYIYLFKHANTQLYLYILGTTTIFALLNLNRVLDKSCSLRRLLLSLMLLPLLSFSSCGNWQCCNHPSGPGTVLVENTV